MKRILVASLTVCLLFGSILATATQESAATSEERAAAFIAALNPDSGTQWENFVTENFSADFVERRGIDHLVRIMTMISDDVGRARIESIEKQQDNTLRLVIYSESADQWLAFGLGLGASPEKLFSSFEARFIPAPLDRGKTGLTGKDLSDEIAAYVRTRAASDQFSGAVIVALHGKPVFAEAFGDADKITRRKNTLDTPINLGSMNKMFTALAIAQLVDDGKLDYEDTVGRHLPDYPNSVVRNEVTIGQLLSHTAGLGSYWGEKFESRKNKLATVADFVDLFAEDPLEQPPGKGFLYSNNGPTVAGLIIEKASGIGYYDYIRQNIYRRAQMTHSDHYRKDNSEAGFAIGYEKTESGEWQDNGDWLGMIGGPAGGGYASANDLLRYANALSGGASSAPSRLRRLPPARSGWRRISLMATASATTCWPASVLSATMAEHPAPMPNSACSRNSVTRLLSSLITAMRRPRWPVTCASWSRTANSDLPGWPRKPGKARNFPKSRYPAIRSQHPARQASRLRKLICWRIVKQKRMHR